MTPSRADLLAVAYGVCALAALGVYGFSLASVGIPALVLLVLFADGIARPGSSLLYPTVTHGPRTGRRVALSFDDGPDPQVTPAVLDALAAHGARATFFCIGRALHAHPALARRIAGERHELGNHSFGHSRFQNFFTSRRQLIEIENGAASVRAVSPTPPQPLYRPPIGLKSPPMAWAARRLGLTVVAWSLHSHDSRDTDAQRIARRVLRKIRPGDIVLLHDGHDLPGRHRPACAQAVSLILAGLRERGLECVPVSELLGGGQPLPAPRARTDTRPGGQLLAVNRRFYDALWREARLVEPRRFNTWPLLHALAARTARRLEVAPGLRPRLPIAGTHFVDLSAPALVRLRASGGAVAQGSITALPFPDGAFGLVCAFDVVEHVDDDARAVAELARVAAPGATVLLAVPLHPAQWTAFDDLVGHRRRYEPQRLRTLLAGHGLDVEHSAVYGMQPRSSRLLDLGMWYLEHRRARAMWWYNRVFMPLGILAQKKLTLVPGLIDDPAVAEVVVVCRRRALAGAPS